jgi:hypothetical protein
MGEVRGRRRSVRGVVRRSVRGVVFLQKRGEGFRALGRNDQEGVFQYRYSDYTIASIL